MTLNVEQKNVAQFTLTHGVVYCCGTYEDKEKPDDLFKTAANVVIALKPGTNVWHIVHAARREEPRWISYVQILPKGFSPVAHYVNDWKAEFLGPKMRVVIERMNLALADGRLLVDPSFFEDVQHDRFVLAAAVNAFIAAERYLER